MPKGALLLIQSPSVLNECLVLIQQKDETHPNPSSRLKYSLFGGCCDTLEDGTVEGGRETVERELDEELPGFRRFLTSPIRKVGGFDEGGGWYSEVFAVEADIRGAVASGVLSGITEGIAHVMSLTALFRLPDDAFLPGQAAFLRRNL
jgi:hypothetical protein